MSTAIDLSQVPAPDVVETIEFEAILKQRKDLLRMLAPILNDVLDLESEPVVKLLEESAYREMVLRARVNDACRAVMLAYATGGDLDNLAAFFGVERLTIDAGDPDAVPPVAPTLESDADLRRRVTLAPEGYSTAGPRRAYIAHTLGADGDVLDAAAQSPTPGDVLVSVLSRTGDGAASPELVAAVQAALDDDDVRPLCTAVTVQSAAIVNYTVDATLVFYSGPDTSVVLADAEAAVTAYVAAQHRIGRDVTLSGIYAALHQPGVQRVTLTSPATDIVIANTEASWCTGITLIDGGTDA